MLDVGCGTGTIDFYIASKGISVLGIDVSTKAIDVARKSSYNLHVEKNARFKCIPFTKFKTRKKFDLILCSEVLEHLTDDVGSVKKMFGLLKKGGLVIASSPSTSAPLYRMGMLKNFDLEVGHLRRYTQESFKSIFIKNRFIILESQLTESIIRNLLYSSKYLSWLIRFIRGYVSILVNSIDLCLVKIFGESQIFIVAKKP